MAYYVYILANSTNTVLYTGVTSDLIRRVWEHRQGADPKSFTSRYHVHRLVFFEDTTDVRAAIQREKQIKGWNRARKNKLVETKTPFGRICIHRSLGDLFEGTDCHTSLRTGSQ